MHLFANGTLMRGEVLHQNLSACTFLKAISTAANYRLFLLGGGTYPGMVRANHETGVLQGSFTLCRTRI